MSAIALTSTHFIKTTLFTDIDGRAKWRDDAVPLSEGSPAAMLSTVEPATGLQLRESPVGFVSQPHCTESPQWLFVLQGEMEIGLADGSTRTFKAGQHFFSADTFPVGAMFDAKIHGHWSRQLGPLPLQTLFIKV